MIRVPAFAAPLVVVLIEWVMIGSRLPDRVATHFGADGQPNGWMSNTGSFGFQVVLLAGMGAVFTLVVPALVRSAPTLVNLPNRDYWLAPERRDEGIAKITNWMAGFWLVFGTGIALVIAFAMSVNLGPEPHVLPTGPFLGVVGGLVLFTFGWLAAMTAAFRIPSS